MSEKGGKILMSQKLQSKNIVFCSSGEFCLLKKKPKPIFTMLKKPSSRYIHI